MSAICSGTTSSPTTSTNNASRPGKCIHEKAYAANAAIVIGMVVAGIATAMLFNSAFSKPCASRAWL